MKKQLLAYVTLSLVTATSYVSAESLVSGPVEPNTVAPVVTGYNSFAGGVNTSVTSSNSIALGRDNVITADDTVVIGGSNHTVAGGQSTIIGYNNSVDASQEQTIIGANSKTTGQGSMAIGTHTETTAIDAVGLGNNIIADKSNAVAIGTNSVTDSAVGVEGITINNTKHVFAGEQPASVVSFGARDRAGFGGVKNYNRQLQNVSAGRIEADSLDAINGSQLYAVVDEVETNAKAISSNKTAIVKTQNNLKDLAIGVQDLGNIVKDNSDTITNNTKLINSNSAKISDLGKSVATNSADIKALTNTALDHEGRITTVEKDTKDIKSDVANTKNQVNINTKDIADLKGKVADTSTITNHINNSINQVNNRINRLGASSASLAGLHPLDFNRNDKASYAISYGHYRNANAVAIGAFYRPNERVMIGAGMSLGAENQYTLNVAFKTGKGSDYINEAKSAQSRISSLESLVAKLTQEVAELKSK